MFYLLSIIEIPIYMGANSFQISVVLVHLSHTILVSSVIEPLGLSLHYTASLV